MSVMAYCDYIADMIQTAVLKNDLNPQADVRFDADNTKNDLHPEEGYFLSTKKWIYMTDHNDKAYKITVEEV